MRVVIDVNIGLKSNNTVVARLLELANFRNDLIIVTGGTRLEEEYQKYSALMRQINSFARKGRSNKVDKRPNGRIDQIEADMASATERALGAIPTECDDFHILALCLDCNADFVVTADHRMSQCIQKIRNLIGHDRCPKPKFVRNIDDLRRIIPQA